MDKKLDGNVFNSAYEKYLSKDARDLIENGNESTLAAYASEFYQRSGKEAEKILKIQLLRKLVELDSVLHKFSVLDDLQTEIPDFDQLQEPHKKRKIQNNTERNGEIQYPHHFPSQNEIVEFSLILRREVKELCDMTTNLKLWIQLSVPKIEDGNNFGVQIQEASIGDVNRVEDHGFVMLEQVAKYFAARAKIASKIIKYPRLEDYQHSLREFDLRMGLSLRLYLVDIRNNYALLHDQLTKNIERIKTPRGNTNAAASMY